MDFLLLFERKNITKKLWKFLRNGFHFILKEKTSFCLGEVFVKWISFYFEKKKLHKKFLIFVKWISLYLERENFTKGFVKFL